MASVQRRIALRVISGYRTISLGATLLLAGIAPIRLLAKERANMWERQQREDETATRLDIIGEAHAALLQECQSEWNVYPKGRWTHRLIRDFKVWTTREYGRLDYWVTQTLSGHGCFGTYLFKNEWRSDPTCQDIDAGWNDMEHAFFHCITYMEVQAQLQQKIWILLETETLVEAMLRGPENRDEIACYFRHVITKKREKEVEMQLMASHEPRGVRPGSRGLTREASKSRCVRACVRACVAVRVCVRVCSRMRPRSRKEEDEALIPWPQG